VFNVAAAPELDRLFDNMEQAGPPVMARAGFAPERIVMKRALEMRYVGQEFSLLIDCPSQSLTPEAMRQIRDCFNEVYAARYGHAFPELMPEVASLRLHVYGVFAKPELNLGGQAKPAAAAKSRAHRPVYFDESGFVECAVYRRPELPVDTVLKGPLVIEEQSSTTIISPLDSVTADAAGNLIIKVGSN
jgi:N-methylhydantoinase A